MSHITVGKSREKKSASELAYDQVLHIAFFQDRTIVLTDLAVTARLSKSSRRLTRLRSPYEDLGSHILGRVCQIRRYDWRSI